jgi:N-acetylglucosaminyldiphosphoundecaprenol N-acetyl-beta-D-mannosaminyltransferase
MDNVPDPVDVLGCPVMIFITEQDAISALVSVVELGHGGYSVAINAEKIMLYRKSDVVRQLIRNATLQIPDGAGAVLGVKALYGASSAKIDFPKCSLLAANRYRWPVYIVGGTEEVNLAAFNAISLKYPDIDLKGRSNGYISEEEMIERITLSRARLVLLGLGSPKQERLASHLKSNSVQVFSVGCGGALDVLAGNARRAPRFMIDNNLEWLFRLMQHPSRWRRQLVLLYFVQKLVFVLLAQKLSKCLP